MWTKFSDLQSGGQSKEEYDYILIEASEDEAVSIFYNRFGHNPYKVACECCGPDYLITTGPSLESLTAYERGSFWNKTTQQWEQRKHGTLFKFQTLEEFKQNRSALFIYSNEIKESERHTIVSRNG